MSTAELANGSKSRETPGKDALPARVFHIDSASSIWAQIGPAENCAAFDKFLDGINLTCEGFGDAGRGVAKPPPVNSVLVLVDPGTGKWERAMVTATGAGGDEFDALLIDTGESRKGNVRNVCNQQVPQLLKMAAQAVQCRLVGFDLDRSTRNTTARLKELFDRATEVKVEVYSVPRKQQCNAAFFAKIDGQWRSVVAALNQFNQEHTPMTKTGVATAEEVTSPPLSPPYEDISPKPANKGPPEDKFAECALNGDAQQPAESLIESPDNSPPSLSLSPPSHLTPTPAQPTPTFSHVTGQMSEGSGGTAGGGHLEVNGEGWGDRKDVSAETSEGTGTKEGVALDLNSSDEEWDESLLVSHSEPPSKDSTSDRRGSFARKVFGRRFDEEKSKSKASFENQFNQLMLSGSGRGRYTHGHHKEKGKSPYRGGGPRGGKGGVNGVGRGLNMARRPLHYGDEVGETPSQETVSMVGVKVTKGPVKTVLANTKEEEVPIVEEKNPVPPFSSTKTGLVLRSDSNDISWYSYRVELCIQESNVHKLLKLAGNERVVLAIVKSLIHTAITAKTGCTEIVAQTIVHFCSSGHPLSETPLFLLPAMEEITSDSLMTSTASDTWKYRRSFSCFFTSLYLSCSRQNNSVLTSTMDQLVHHYLDKWSNRSSASAEQRAAAAPPPSVANIESLVCLLQELGSVLDHQDRKTLDVYFDGVVKDLILNEGQQRPAKEALYNLALQRREWLATNFLGAQEKQAPHPTPPPPLPLPPPQFPPSEARRERGDVLLPTPHTTVAETTVQQHQVLPSALLHGNMIFPVKSPPHMATASKDPYKLVRQVLEELGCPEQISKFTGACFTDMVLEGCDHETVWKGLKELGVPMGVATCILGMKQKGKTKMEAAPAGVGVEWTSAQQRTSVAMAPQQYTSFAMTPQQYTSVAVTPQQYTSVAVTPQEHTSVAMAPQQYSLPFPPAYSVGTIGWLPWQHLDHHLTPSFLSLVSPSGPQQQMAPVYMAPSGTPLQMMPTNPVLPLLYGGDQLWKPRPTPHQDVCHSQGGEGVPLVGHVGSRLYGSQQTSGLSGVAEVQLLPPPRLVQGGEGVVSLLTPSNVGPKLYGNQQTPSLAEVQLPPPPQPQPPQSELQWRFGRTLCVVCGSDSHQSHSCPKRSERLFVH
eukprot:Em0013g237a